METTPLILEQVKYKKVIHISTQEFQDIFFNILQHHTNMLVIGDGSMGDKARMLAMHEQLINKVGLKIPKTIVLCDDIINSMATALELDHTSEKTFVKQFQEKYKDDKNIPNTIIKNLSEYQGYFENKGLIVRFSGEGDSTGTGIYKTVLPSSNDEHNDGKDNGASTQQLLIDILTVVDSYSSTDGKEYRRIAKLGKGFSVMLQPVIQNNITYIDKYGDKMPPSNGPIISGNGTTSTMKYPGQPILSIQAGIGGAVNRGVGIPNLGKKYFGGGCPLQKLYLSSNDNISENGGESLSRTTQSEKFHTLLKKYNNFSLIPLYTMLEELEKEIGTKLYVEFACKKSGSKYIFYITQISELPEDHIDIIDFDTIKNPLISLNQTISTGRKKCTNILYCPTLQHLGFLENYNSTNSNYILILGSEIVTRSTNINGLCFNKYSNAGTIIVEKSNKLGADLSSHFQGLSKATNIFLGGTNDSFVNNTLIQSNEGGVIEGEYQVISSEAQQRLVVEKLESNKSND